eukprot:273391-Chlamydomonas_euryale.AAC.1
MVVWVGAAVVGAAAGAAAQRCGGAAGVGGGCKVVTCTEMLRHTPAGSASHVPGMHTEHAQRTCTRNMHRHVPAASSSEQGTFFHVVGRIKAVQPGVLPVRPSTPTPPHLHTFPPRSATAEATCGVLASALCRIVCCRAVDLPASSQLPPLPPPPHWSAHPLSQLLLLQPSVGPHLVAACVERLAAVAEDCSHRGRHAAAAVWGALLPFFVCGSDDVKVQVCRSQGLRSLQSLPFVKCELGCVWQSKHGLKGS